MHDIFILSKWGQAVDIDCFHFTFYFWLKEARSQWVNKIAPHVSAQLLLLIFTHLKVFTHMQKLVHSQEIPTGGAVMKCHYFWHMVTHDRCILFADDDFLWCYHRKANNETGIWKPESQIAKMEIKGGVTLSAYYLIPPTPLLWQNVWIFFLIWRMIGAV